MVWGEVVPEKATHAPESRLYWTVAIALPPSDAPSVKATVSEETLPVILEIEGASGGDMMESAVEEVVSAPHPVLLCAAAVHVYSLPRVRSATVTGLVGFVLKRVKPPFDEVQVPR